jgi:hypothetical protein
LSSQKSKATVESNAIFVESVEETTPNTGFFSEQNTPSTGNTSFFTTDETLDEAEIFTRKSSRRPSLDEEQEVADSSDQSHSRKSRQTLVDCGEKNTQRKLSLAKEQRMPEQQRSDSPNRPPVKRTKQNKMLNGKFKTISLDTEKLKRD